MASTGISRSRIREIGDTSRDPFAFSEVSAQLAELCFDGASSDVERDAAYVAIFTIVEQEYTGKGGIPPELEVDQVEDWLVGRGVYAGFVARRAQDLWSEAFSGRTEDQNG